MKLLKGLSDPKADLMLPAWPKIIFASIDPIMLKQNYMHKY